MISARRLNSLWMWDRLVDRKTGVVKMLSFLMKGHHEPRFYLSITDISRMRRISPFLGGISSTGVGLTSIDAMNAALGEAAEGYCCTAVPHGLVKGSWNGLRQAGYHALYPEDFPLFSEQQYARENFPFKPFVEDTVLRWVRGVSLVKQTEKLVPAALVYCNYEPEEQESRICPTNFAGTGCGTTRDGAVLAALYEVIERDAMMIWWLNQLAVPRCRPVSGSWFSRVFEERFAHSGLQFELREITTDLRIPTYFGLVTDPFNKVVSGGFASRLDPQAAALKSLFECIQNRIGVLSLRQGAGVMELNSRLGKKVLHQPRENQSLYSVYGDDFSEMTQLNANLQFYADPSNLCYLKAIRSNKDETLLTSSTNGYCVVKPSDDFPVCLGAIRRRGFDVIAVDITLPDIRELGLFVVRVLVPGLVPNSVTAWPHLGCPRLYEVPERLGFRGKSESELETAPMPYG